MTDVQADTETESSDGGHPNMQTHSRISWYRGQTDTDHLIETHTPAHCHTEFLHVENTGSHTTTVHSSLGFAGLHYERNPASHTEEHSQGNTQLPKLSLIAHKV